MFKVIKRNGIKVTPESFIECLENGESPEDLANGNWEIWTYDISIVVDYDGWVYTCNLHDQIDDSRSWETVEHWDICVKHCFLTVDGCEYELPEWEPPEDLDTKRPSWKLVDTAYVNKAELDEVLEIRGWFDAEIAYYTDYDLDESLVD